MGTCLSNLCYGAEVGDCSENRLSREFEEKDVSFPCISDSARKQSCGLVPQNGLITPQKHGEDSFSYSISSELSESILVIGEANLEDKVEKSISQFSSSFSKAESTGCSILRNEAQSEETASNSGESVLGLKVEACSERLRSGAIDIKTIISPEGKFLSEKQFYTQRGNGEWESVRIEHWNPWNGTWQVKGSNDKTFAAAPIALKSITEYEFLSRERYCNPRTFGSLRSIDCSG